MHSRCSRPFQKRLFNLFGPTHDEAEITRFIAALQAQKRQVYIVDYEDVSLSDAQVIADAVARYRLAQLIRTGLPQS
jgi:hypothetical protein